MAEIARGSIGDRPWGRTLWTMAARSLSGQMTLRSDRGQIAIAFQRGVIVGALTTVQMDTAAQIAMQAGLLGQAYVAEIARRAGKTDDIDIVIDAARLPPDHGLRLRRRVVAQRAARTFSFDVAEFIIHDQVAFAILPGSELDIRTVILMGAKQNLSEARLHSDLASYGDWFWLRPENLPQLPQFGFAPTDQPVIELLGLGLSLGELVSAQHGLDARTVRAIIYALASCGLCETDPAARDAKPRAPARPTRPPQRPTTGAIPPQRTTGNIPVQRGAPIPPARTTPGGSVQALRPSGSRPAQPDPLEMLDLGDATDAKLDLGGAGARAEALDLGGAEEALDLGGGDGELDLGDGGDGEADAVEGQPAGYPGSEDDIDGGAGGWSPDEELDLGGGGGGFELEAPDAGTRSMRPSQGPIPGMPGAKPSAPPAKKPAAKPGGLPPAKPGGLPPAKPGGLPSAKPAAGIGLAPAKPAAGIGGGRAAAPGDLPPPRAAGGIGMSPAKPGTRSAPGDLPPPRAATGIGAKPAGGPRAAPGDLPPPRQTGGIQTPTRTTQAFGSKTPPPVGLQPMSRSTPNPTKPPAPAGLQPMQRSSPGITPPRRTTGNLDAAVPRQPGPKPNKRPTAPPSMHAEEAQQLIQQRIALVDDGADHYALLGVAADATDAEIRKAYFGLARKLHPDRLAALQIDDPSRNAHRVMAQVNTAFAALSDAKQRREYDDLQKRGGAKAMAAEQEYMMRALQAEQFFERGVNALKGNQVAAAIKELQQAVKLKDDEPDYIAALAWAEFCAASDKNAATAKTRRILAAAISKAPETAVDPRLYLGRVERMAGRDQEALRLFREVLEIEPRNGEATSEIRVLESRGRARK